MATGDKLVKLDGLKAVYDKVNGDVGDLKSDFNNALWHELGVKVELNKIDGKYYDLSGNTVDINNPTSLSSYECAVIPCQPNDCFIVSSKGQSRSRALGFVKSNGEIVRAAAANTNLSYYFVEAPDESAYLIVNNYKLEKEMLVISIDKKFVAFSSDEIKSITVTDLNDLQDFGQYKYIYSSTMLHTPAHANGTIYVIKNNPRITQICLTIYGYIYIRYLYNGTWSEWSRLATKSDVDAGDATVNDRFARYWSLFITGDTTTIGANSDLDDYITPGNFYVSTYNVSNLPIYSSGRLTILSSAPTIIYQFYIANNGRLFKRYYNSNTTAWSEWDELFSNKNNLLNLSSAVVIGANSDLNDYTTPLTAYIQTDVLSTLSNKPNGARAGRLFVYELANYVNYIMQEYIYVDGTTYRRSMLNGVWSVWSKMLTDADGGSLSFGRRNAIASVNQMANIKWTPIRPIPATTSEGYIKAGVECTGLPYSSTRSVCKYIGQHVSIYTFMSALQNPKSVLYTRRIKYGSLGKTYYGVTCFTVTSYASGSRLGVFDNENMRAKNGDAVEISPYEILPGDAIMIPTSYRYNPSAFRHEIVIYDVQKDSAGRITNVKFAEGTPPFVLIRYSWMTFNSFLNYIANYGYKVYRKTGRIDFGTYEPIPFVKGYEDEVLEPVSYPDIMPEYGDKACVEAGTDVAINIINSAGYNQVLVYKDDVLIDTKPVEDFTMSNMAYGTYRFVLTDGTNTSESSLIVADVQGSYDPDTKRITFSSANATPSFVAAYATSTSMAGVQDYVYNFTQEDLANGYADVSELVFPVWDAVQIGFKTEYGVAMWWSNKLTGEWEYWTPPAEALS